MQEKSDHPKPKHVAIPMAAAATAAAFALGGWIPAIGVIGAQYAAYVYSKK